MNPEDTCVGPFDAEEINKWANEKEKTDPSAGRVISGALLPGIHGAVAGKKNHKWQAAGNELGGSAVGGVVGLAPVGGGVGTHRAHKMGHYKAQPKKKVKKNFSESAFGIEH